MDWITELTALHAHYGTPATEKGMSGRPNDARRQQWRNRRGRL